MIRIRILSWNHGVLQCDIPPEERSGKTGSQPEEESIGVNNSATQEKQTITQDKKETETTAQMETYHE